MEYYIYGFVFIVINSYCLFLVVCFSFFINDFIDIDIYYMIYYSKNN